MAERCNTILGPWLCDLDRGHEGQHGDHESGVWYDAPHGTGWSQMIESDYVDARSNEGSEE